MLFVNAEDDGLLHAVSAFLQKFCDAARYDLGAVIEYERPVEVLLVINAVFDFISVAILLALLRPVAIDVLVDMDLDDFVGCEEAVADAFLQGVAVDRITKVIDVRDLFGLLGRRSETNLSR